MWKKLKKYTQIIAIYMICFIPGFAFAGCVGGEYVGNDYQTLNMNIDDQGNTPLQTDSMSGCAFELVEPTLDAEGDVISYGNMNMFSSIACMVQSIMAKAMFKIYCPLLEQMTPIVTSLIVLYIMFYGAQVAIGSQKGKLTAKDGVIARAILIIVIYSLAVNADIFYFWMYGSIMRFIHGFGTLIASIDYGDKIVISPIVMNVPAFDSSGNPMLKTDGSAVMTSEVILQANNIGTNVTSTNLFSGIDRMFDLIVGTERLMGLFETAYAMILKWFPFGIFYSFGILGLIFVMMESFIKIFTNYLTALVKLSFILIFAPIFVVLALFERTRSIFDGWISAVISYVLQISLVMAFIFVLQLSKNIAPMMSYIQAIGNYNKDKIWTFDILFMEHIEYKAPGFDYSTGCEKYMFINETPAPRDIIDEDGVTVLFASGATIPANTEITIATPPTGFEGNKVPSSTPPPGTKCTQKIFGCVYSEANPEECVAPRYKQLFIMIGTFWLILLFLSKLTNAALRPGGITSQLAQQLAQYSGKFVAPVITGASASAKEVAQNSTKQADGKFTSGRRDIYNAGGVIRDIGGIFGNLIQGSGKMGLAAGRNAMGRLEESKAARMFGDSGGPDGNNSRGGGTPPSSGGDGGTTGRSGGGGTSPTSGGSGGKPPTTGGGGDSVLRTDNRHIPDAKESMQRRIKRFFGVGTETGSKETTKKVVKEGVAEAGEKVARQGVEAGVAQVATKGVTKKLGFKGFAKIAAKTVMFIPKKIPVLGAIITAAEGVAVVSYLAITGDKAMAKAEAAAYVAEAGGNIIGFAGGEIARQAAVEAYASQTGVRASDAVSVMAGKASAEAVGFDTSRFEAGGDDDNQEPSSEDDSSNQPAAKEYGHDEAAFDKENQENLENSVREVIKEEENLKNKKDSKDEPPVGV